MNPSSNPQQLKPDYGIDAPGLLRFFFAAGLMAALLTAAILLMLPTWRFVITPLGTLATVYLLGMGTLMLVWRKAIKVKTRHTILTHIPWCGDEQVLDIGCGRGLMLIGAAKRLTTGKATGIDIWQTSDQSANTPEAALENARIEGVSDRVNVGTADMRNLPYGDKIFDVVISHWVVHNLPSAADRIQAIAEMHRVLKPNGHLILADIEHRNDYTQQLAMLGFKNIEVEFNKVSDTILRAISGGSFGPATHYATK